MLKVIFNEKGEIFYKNSHESEINFALEGNEKIGYELTSDLGKRVLFNTNYQSALRKSKKLMIHPFDGPNTKTPFFQPKR